MSIALKEYSIDIIGTNYFEVVSARLETLKGGETDFVLSMGYVLKRSIYLILGFLMLILNVLKADRKKTKDFYNA